MRLRFVSLLLLLKWNRSFILFIIITGFLLTGTLGRSPKTCVIASLLHPFPRPLPFTFTRICNTMDHSWTRRIYTGINILILEESNIRNKFLCWHDIRLRNVMSIYLENRKTLYCNFVLSAMVSLAEISIVDIFGILFY